MPFLVIRAFTSQTMSLPLIVGGSVAIDNIITPGDSAENLLGGSAAYASLAASYFTQPVHIVGIIGHDYPEEHLEMLKNHGVTQEGIERSDKESFTWTGEYHENMNDRTTHAVALNVMENWVPKVPESLSETPIVILANMSPENQLDMLSGCTAEKRLVLADSMDLWIQIAREKLDEVLTKLDIFVLNDSEAKEYTGTNNLMLAGERLLKKGPRFVIIKLGEFGAMLFGPDQQHFRLPAYPLKEVKDPTGAGDSFLGGLAGFLAEQGTIDPTFEQLSNALVRGTVVASFTCEAFSTKAIEAVSREEIEERIKAYKNVTKFS